MNKLNENIKRIKSLMMISESEEDVTNVNKGEDDQDPVQKQGPDGMDDDSDKELGESEISEEGDAPTETTTQTTTTGSETDTKTSTGYPSMKLWKDIASAAVGKGNPRDDKKKWESGATVSPNRKEPKWKSGRKFGPTGDNYK